MKLVVGREVLRSVQRPLSFSLLVSVSIRQLLVSSTSNWSLGLKNSHQNFHSCFSMHFWATEALPSAHIHRASPTWPARRPHFHLHPGVCTAASQAVTVAT